MTMIKSKLQLKLVTTLPSRLTQTEQ